MSITSITSNLAPELSQGLNQLGGVEAADGDKTSFSKLLEKSVSEVNNLLGSADKVQESLLLGKSENLHEAMIATEKAETALKFMVQVRNKALEAYHEILRMQI